jgi:UDP-N-acetylmuramate--alanine ligase
MSAIARYYSRKGVVVSGYDKTPSAITDALIQEGINVYFEDDLTKVDQQADLIIYTPAIPKGSILLNYYLDNGFEVIKRSKALGIISADAFTIAVSGSHGKTTVSSMIAHVLKHSGKDCSAFLGGISKNYRDNYIQGNNNIVVVEADEFDRSFHQLSPDMIVITAVDTDHLDIYGSKEKIEEAFIIFTQKLKSKHRRKQRDLRFEG